MVVLYLEWQQCTLSNAHGFLWTPQRTGFIPNSYQIAEGQLAKDAPGQVHSWCDTLEADGIESAIPVKPLCHRSFIKRLCWWILLSQSYFWPVANPLGSWQVQLSEHVPFNTITYQNRRPLIWSADWGDLQICLCLKKSVIPSPVLGFKTFIILIWNTNTN